MLFSPRQNNSFSASLFIWFIDLYQHSIFRHLSKYRISFYVCIVNTLFKALGDETRREILAMLRERDMNAGEIADAFNISKPSISHHLDLLKQAGLVTYERDGQYIRYSLNTTVLDEALSWVMQLKSKNNNPKNKKR